MNKIWTQNHTVYSDDKVCDSYLNMNDLFEPEKVLLDFLKGQIKEGDKILDIGIGAGRTTRYLKLLSSAYTGVDYSRKMVDLAKARFPSLNLLECDARDLNQFKDGEFSLVFFSFNGMDYISHDDRLRALSEIKRVLNPKGYFVFSSHNRNYVHFDKLRFPYNGSPLRYLWHVMHGVNSWLKNVKAHAYENEYAIVTDPGHNYRLLTYYIAPGDQCDQLRTAGFSGNIKIFDLKGNIVSDSAESSWLYYLVPKE